MGKINIADVWSHRCKTLCCLIGIDSGSGTLSRPLSCTRCCLVNSNARLWSSWLHIFKTIDLLQPMYLSAGWSPSLRIWAYLSLQALQRSNLLTDDIWAADMVLVYDYCYYTWWLGHVQSTGGQSRDSPGSSLVKVQPFMSPFPAVLLQDCTCSLVNSQEHPCMVMPWGGHADWWPAIWWSEFLAHFVV